MGFQSAEDRLSRDRSYAWLIVSRMAGTYPAAFVALAARMARGADAAAQGLELVPVEAGERGDLPVSLPWLGGSGRGDLLVGLMPPEAATFVIVVGLPALLFVAGAFFLMGWCTGGLCNPFALVRCCARRSGRALRAFCFAGTEPVAETRVRHVGVMSMCQYTWYDNNPRFVHGIQGFRRAGEVTVDH
jgi:hypothetical protein